MAPYSEINTAFDESQSDRRTMNSNHHAVFVASLQCTDEEKVVPRGNPRPPTQLDVGIKLEVNTA